jgi:TonB family protein
VTLPVGRPIVPAARPVHAVPPIQSVALDARPLLAGETFQIGLPDGLPVIGMSQGPGSGGGVGDGIGTGIGSGRGPGMGPGVGGGIGGGIYRPGGGVTTPTVIREVRPTYTPEAMRAKIQGFVVLDVVVQRDGTPGEIRIVRSLDPGGLDRQALVAVRGWRFSPGRLNGVPVDVLVTIELMFRVH